MTSIVKRVLVLVHSSDWRTRFGEEYVELLGRKPLDAFDVLDAIRSGARSHARPQSWAPLSLAVAGAVFTGFLNLQNDERLPAAAVIMLFCFALTVWKPQHWWLWLTIGALSVPSSYLVASAAHLYASHPAVGARQAFAAFGPAGVAAAIAICLRIAVAVRGCRKRRLFPSRTSDVE